MTSWEPEHDRAQHGLERLPDLTHGLEVDFPPGMPTHIQRLMAALGVKIRFVNEMPTPSGWRKHEDR